MTFVSYIYDNLSWTTGTLQGGNNRGLGGKAAKVFTKYFHLVGWKFIFFKFLN